MSIRHHEAQVGNTSRLNTEDGKDAEASLFLTRRRQGSCHPSFWIYNTIRFKLSMRVSEFEGLPIGLTELDQMSRMSRI
jgi:hypothetical protein